MRSQLPIALAALSLAGSGCDYTVLSTSVGDHVVYHWDADENQLCGGTVVVADRFMEAVPAHYGLPPNIGGPEVEYFWGLRETLSACSWVERKDGCARRGLSGHVVLAEPPLYAHELAHATRGGYGQPPFVSEGFAVRWQSALVDDAGWRTQPKFLNAAQLRAQLEVSHPSNVSYPMAHTWWVALEATYGPAKMGEFIATMGGSASADDVEAALQRVFGISLADSVTLAESLPEILLDDPACLFTDLPTLVWTGEPLVLDRGDDVRCADDDVMNMPGSRASWLFALEFPANGVELKVAITVAEGLEPDRGLLALSWCDGEVNLTDAVGTYHFDATAGTDGRTMYLGGRYVAALQGVLEEDGSIVLPRVVFEETSP